MPADLSWVWVAMRVPGPSLLLGIGRTAANSTGFEVFVILCTIFLTEGIVGKGGSRWCGY
ncbi:MAG: hypothetical protein R3E04_01615 [Sphingobium sp.]